jgi:hypothetical protein
MPLHLVKIILFMLNKNLLQKIMLFVFAALIGSTAMAQLPKVYVTSNITSNTTWTSSNIYVLSGYIYVTSGATLTIEPGTVIYGNDPTLFSKGALIVTRGSQIQAVGTPCRPIVFTSGIANPKQRKRGDWGGVILLGYAHINPLGDTAHIEGIPPNDLTLFGGGKNPNCGGGDCPDNTDNSGTLEYVRIEYAGVALSPNNEINGLTFGGTGSGTVIDHVQVSYANDDSYEWFGGYTNCKYIIAFRGIDDDFDTDNGYSGKVQFAVGLRDKTVADVSGSKGFESDNDANGSTQLPQTRGIFCNITSDAGGDTTTNSLFVSGDHIRRNSHLYIYNSIIMGWPEGNLIDGTLSQNSVLADTLVNNNVFGVFHGNSFWTVTASPSGNTSVIDLLNNHAGNRYYTGNAQIKLVKPYTVTATVSPNFEPKAGSPAHAGANFHHAVLNDPFFTPTTYIGAVATQGTAADWTQESWVNWKPDTTNYSNGAFGHGCGAPVVNGKQESAINAVVANVKLSPNPTNGTFNIAVSGFTANVVNVKISDLNTGKPYFIGKANNNSTTNISIHAPNGNYVVELSDGKTVITRKITVLN